MLYPSAELDAKPYVIYYVVYWYVVCELCCY